MTTSSPQNHVSRRSGWTVLLIGCLAITATGCALLNKPKVDRVKYSDEFSCGEPKRPSVTAVKPTEHTARR